MAARIITKSAATRVEVSVTIESFHRPSQRMPARQISAATPARQPPTITAIARMASALMNHGEPAMTYSSLLMMALVKASAMLEVAVAQWVEIQSIAFCTPLEIQSPSLPAGGRAKKSTVRER